MKAFYFLITGMLLFSCTFHSNQNTSSTPNVKAIDDVIQAFDELVL